MDNKEIAEGQIGQDAKYDIEFKDGKLVAEVVYAGQFAEAGVVVKLPASAIKEAIKKAIPGQIDDLVLDAAFKLLGVE